MEKSPVSLRIREERNLVFEKMYKEEDGTFVLLRAENEEQMAQWDLERLTMLEDPKFRHKVEDDCKFLENAIKKANESITDWMIVEDFVNFADIYEESRSQPYYDFRYPYSPSRVRGLKQQLWWMLDLLRNWYKLLESRVEKPRKQVKKPESTKPSYEPKKPKKKELTIGEELARAESISTERRGAYLHEKGTDVALAWIWNRIEKRQLEREREAQEKTKTKLARYASESGYKAKSEELAEKKDVTKDLREILEVWTKEARTDKDKALKETE